MIKKLIRIIDNYECIFELGCNVVSVLFRSYEEDKILFNHFTNETLPDNLNNIVKTSQELYHVFINIEKDKVKVNNHRELILSGEIFGLMKEYAVKMRRTDLF